MKTNVKESPYLTLRMPEWRDGQPGCMGCLKELSVGSRVLQAKSFLYYCSTKCADKHERKSK